MPDIPQATQKAIGPSNELISGVVTAFSTTSVTVLVRSVTVTMQALASYMPVVGDVVSVFVGDSSMVCLGRIMSTTETWQSVTLQNGWTNAGGAAGLKFHRDGGNMLWVTGTITSPNPFNSTIGTLPSPYRTNTGVDQGIFAWTGTGSQLVKVDGNGALTAFGSSTTLTNWWVNGAVRILTS